MAVTAIAGVIGTAPLLGIGAADDSDGLLHVQVLAVNDFHGHIEPDTPGTVSTRRGRVRAGGIEFLAAHIEARRADNPNTVVVSAGDLIGASPFVSAFFHDEPTIEGWNRAGLDFNAVGNHEFDEGRDELARMQQGGCHPRTGAATGTASQAPASGSSPRTCGARTGERCFRPTGSGPSRAPRSRSSA
jgi:5'-nucleotidase